MNGSFQIKDQDSNDIGFHEPAKPLLRLLQFGNIHHRSHQVGWLSKDIIDASCAALQPLDAPISQDRVKILIIQRVSLLGERTRCDLTKVLTISRMHDSQKGPTGPRSSVQQAKQRFTVVCGHDLMGHEVLTPQAHAGSFHRQLFLFFIHLLGCDIRATDDELTNNSRKNTHGKNAYAHQAVDPIASANVAHPLRWLTGKSGLVQRFFYLWLIGGIHGIKPASLEVVALPLPSKGLPTGADFLHLTCGSENPEEIRSSLNNSQKTIGPRCP